MSREQLEKQLRMLIALDQPFTIKDINILYLPENDIYTFILESQELLTFCIREVVFDKSQKAIIVYHPLPGLKPSGLMATTSSDENEESRSFLHRANRKLSSASLYAFRAITRLFEKFRSDRKD